MTASTNLARALEEIGLQPHEAEIYLALLRSGKSTAGPLVTSTKLHRQIVYTALERLENRGIVSHTLQNNRRNVVALPPEDLLRKEMERFRRFTSVVPDLSALQRQANNQVHVETFVGSNELIQSLLSAVDSAAKGDSVLRITGGERATDLYKAMGVRYADYVEYVREKGVTKRLITSPSTIDQYRLRFLREPGSQLRLHDVGFSMPTYSLMTHELMDLCIIADEVLVLRVRNKTLARTYIEQFDLLWKLGKPVRRSTQERAFQFKGGKLKRENSHKRNSVRR